MKKSNPKKTFITIIFVCGIWLPYKWYDPFELEAFSTEGFMIDLIVAGIAFGLGRFIGSKLYDPD